MGCPPVCGDNPQALVSGLSYVQVDKHGITIYTTYISEDLAHHEIVRAKVGIGGISPLSCIRPLPVQFSFSISNCKLPVLTAAFCESRISGIAFLRPVLPVARKSSIDAVQSILALLLEDVAV